MTEALSTPSFPPGATGDDPTAVDLFCGAGGASCGMWQAGATLVAGVDNNDPAPRRPDNEQSTISSYGL